MSGTQAINYRDRHGRQPVEEFIDGLPRRHQAAVDLAIDRLNGLLPNEPPLAFPATSQASMARLQGVALPLRARCSIACSQTLEELFVLLHMLRKTPGGSRRRTSIAQARWEDFKAGWTHSRGALRAPPR